MTDSCRVPSHPHTGPLGLGFASCRGRTAQVVVVGAAAGRLRRSRVVNERIEQLYTPPPRESPCRSWSIPAMAPLIAERVCRGWLFGHPNGEDGEQVAQRVVRGIEDGWVEPAPPRQLTEHDVTLFLRWRTRRVAALEWSFSATSSPPPTAVVRCVNSRSSSARAARDWIGQ